MNLLLCFQSKNDKQGLVRFYISHVYVFRSQRKLERFMWIIQDKSGISHKTRVNKMEGNTILFSYDISIVAFIDIDR